MASMGRDGVVSCDVEWVATLLGAVVMLVMASKFESPWLASVCVIAAVAGLWCRRDALRRIRRREEFAEKLRHLRGAA